MMKNNNDKKNDTGHHGGMGNRGVTRPMAEMEMQNKHSHQHKEEKRGDQSKKGHSMEMNAEQRMEMLKMHHMQTLWVYWMLIILGFWMILSPLTFSYAKSTVSPSGGREVWLSLSQRITVMTWSDVISGILLIFLGWRSLMPNRPVSLWLSCFVGIWLNIAPLIFWAPSAAAYINDTMVGTLIICLTILIPGMPNMIKYMKMGSQVPPGWSYNPSSWPQRWIMMVTGFLGWVVSRYLAAYQLGYIDFAWDPFFGEGSRLVLDSKMSHSLPVSDGGLGALAYTFEFLMGWMGSPSRWRTMPWMVAVFGILVIPLGLVHITLVLSQPIVVGHWCTLCLLAAGIMLPMIPLEVDEVVAMGQHMVQAKKRGDSFWKVFWKGGEPLVHNMDERSPSLMELPEKPWKVFKASIWGMTFPWTLVFASVLGIWLMASPGIFGMETQATSADVNHICGSLIVVVSVISMGEVLRMGRYLNLLLGLAVAVLPWFVGEGPLLMNITSAVAGLAAAGLSIPRGIIKEKYGSWDRFIK